MAHPAHKQGDCPVMGCSECRRLADETMDQLLNNARTRVWQKLYTQADLDKAVAAEREAIAQVCDAEVRRLRGEVEEAHRYDHDRAHENDGLRAELVRVNSAYQDYALASAKDALAKYEVCFTELLSTRAEVERLKAEVERLKSELSRVVTVMCEVSEELVGGWPMHGRSRDYERWIANMAAKLSRVVLATHKSTSVR